MRRWRWVVYGLGIAAALPVLLVTVACVAAPGTWWGLATCAGALVAVAGAVTLPWRRRRGVTTAGVAAVLLVTLLRLILVDGSPRASVVVIGGGGGERRLNRIVDEEDVALSAARLLSWADGFSRAESDELLPAMRRAYGRMRRAEGAVPSPFLSTWLGRQSPDAFDAVVLPPAIVPTRGIVFLHGFAGNFTLPCWQFSRAAVEAGWLVVCPSTGPNGAWWTEDGLMTVQRTIAWLHGRGVHRIVLAGLSNGALGASALAPKLRGELTGLILISGASPEAEPAGIPTLVIHGAGDTRLPMAAARTYAERAAPLAEVHELPGGHFILLARADEVHDLIAAWLRGLPY